MRSIIAVVALFIGFMANATTLAAGEVSTDTASNDVPIRKEIRRKRWPVGIASVQDSVKSVQF